MREWGKVKTTIWRNEKFRSFTERARTLALYLIACPHGNSLGCFEVPTMYIAADLGWSPEDAATHLGELERGGFIEVDHATSLIRLTSWWEHNTIENRNVAKAAIKVLASLPRSQIKTNCIKAIIAFNNEFMNEYSDVLSNAILIPSQSQSLALTRAPEPKPSRPPAGDGSKWLKDFDEWLPVYPRRDDKGHARKAYLAARAKGATREQLLEGARRYASERRGQDRKFTALAATWLNGERWLDGGEPDFGMNGSSQENVWRARVSGFFGPHHLWLENQWGPPPGAAGCAAPAAIVAEFKPIEVHR